MTPEMKAAIQEGVHKYSRGTSVDAIAAELREANRWTDKELREITLSIRAIVDDPPRRPRRYVPSDN